MRKGYCLMLILMIVLSLGLIDSQLELNKKQYNEIEKTVTIKDGFNRELSSLKLDTPLDNKIMDRGEGVLQPVWEVKMTPKTLSITLDDFNSQMEMEFYDTKTDVGFSRDYELRYKLLTSNETQIIPDSYSCEDSKESFKNKTIKQTCSYKSTKKIFVEKYEWKPLTEKSLFKMNEPVTIAMFIDVVPGESIEWIPTFYNIRIPEWATWTESFNDDIQIHISMNESASGTVVDDLDRHNGTPVSSPEQGVSGVLGNGIHFNDGVADLVNLTTWKPKYSSTDNFSISIWFNASTTQDIYLFGVGDAGNEIIGCRVDTPTDTVICPMRDSGGTGDNPSTGAVSTGEWTHLAVTRNTASDEWCVYLNTTKNCIEDTTTSDFDFEDDFMYVGAFNDRGDTITGSFDGRLDQFIVWNRTLTDAEVTDLHSGITYRDFQPTVTLNNPINNTNSSSSSITFSGTCTQGENSLDYCNLYGNWSSEGWHQNQTNSSPINASQTNFTVTIEEGKFIWSYFANETDGNSAYGVNRTILIDLTKPNITNVSIDNSEDSTSFEFNATQDDNFYLDTCWYNVIDTSTSNTDIPNTTFSCNSNITDSVSSLDKTWNLTIFVNDTAGNENSTTKQFTTTDTTGGGSTGGGGGGNSPSSQLDPATNFSIKTTNNQNTLEFSLPKKSEKPRDSEFLIINTRLNNINIDISCEDSTIDSTINKSSRNINICDYVTFDKESYEVIPNENEPTRAIVYIETPENSSFGDEYFFNIVGISEDDKFAKLSVKGTVSFTGEFYKFGNIIGTDIIYPIFPTLFIISSIIFVFSITIFVKIKRPMTGLFFSIPLFFLVIILGQLFFPI